MAYTLKDKLVVAIASSALFDLTESDQVFREKGEAEYRKYQREHEDTILQPGVAFQLVERLLKLTSVQGQQMVEVILFSRNDPDTGLRVFKSIQSYGLPITRAVFTMGRNPFAYLQAFDATLFLSGNKEDVQEAIKHDLPAGHVAAQVSYENDIEDEELRIAFDFDGVLADDSAELIYQSGDLESYQEHEDRLAEEPLPAGPLFRFLKGIANIQKEELRKHEEDESYQPKLRVALCTARNAPAIQRVVTTLREWEIRIDEAFFLGGIEKIGVLNVYKPHIFFDDHPGHIENVSKRFPSVHIPYGAANLEKENN